MAKTDEPKYILLTKDAISFLGADGATRIG